MSSPETTQRLPRFFILFVAALIALGPLAIDTYLPALPTMALAFGVNIVQVNNTLSIYLLGFAFGQIIGGPVSDQIGRRPVGLVGLVIFTACSFFIARATTINEVLLLRGVQAVGGGFATVICMAMVRDAYPAAEAAKQFPKVMLVMLTAPLVAPAIGAALLGLGWASIFVFLGVYALIMALVLSRTRETALTRTGRLQPGRIVPQYLAVLTLRERGKLVGLRWIISQGLMSSLMLIFITNASFIFLEHYQVGEQWFVFYFSANVIAMMLGTGLTSRLIHKFPPFRLYTVARLLQLMTIAVLAVLTIMMDLPALVFTPILAFAFGCAGMIGPSVQGMYLAPFGKLSGSATSLMSMAVFLFGSVLGVVSGWFYNGTLVPVLLTILAALVVGNLVAMSIPAPNMASNSD